MKIGIYTPYLKSMSGGEKYILTLALLLVEKHSVEVFWSPKEADSLSHLAKEKLGLDVSPLHFVPNIFEPSISLTKRLLVTKKYDRIVYLSDGSIPLVSAKLLIHFQFPVEWVRMGAVQQFKIKRVYKFFCNSAFTQHYIDKKFHVHSELLYPPVDFQYVEKVTKENIILHVGRLHVSEKGEYYKKQDVLLQAFTSLVDKREKDWQLVMLTSATPAQQQELEHLKRAAQGYPVKIITNATNDTLWSYYNKAKIYWHASGYGEDLATHPELAEHFGISTVEAMGAGVVPVVIDAGGQKEIVQNEKNGFLWATIDELKEKTTRLMHGEALRLELASAAQQDAQQYSVNRFREHLEKIIT